MAQSYVPEGTTVICTAMKSPQDNSIISSRSEATVFHTNKKAILLNKKDLKLSTAFVCNYNSKFWGGLKMLGAIVAVGALAIATVATGGLALVAVGVAAAAIGTSMYSQYKEIAHTCDMTLQSKWINFHSSVNLNGSNALLKTSTLICNKGGALSLVMDPVLARKAAQKIAANNTKEYQKHINSQGIQGVLLLLSSGGDPKQLALGFPLAVANYTYAENKKQEARAGNLETLLTEKGADPQTEGFFESLPGGAEISARDAAIGVAYEASYSPAIMMALQNNVNIVKLYPRVVNASLRSKFPTAALRLNSSIYLAAARKTFNPTALKSLGKGFAWGMAGAAVDAGYDVAENNIYADTIDYFKYIQDQVETSEKGITVISN